jgi:hypothetical protein
VRPTRRAKQRTRKSDSSRKHAEALTAEAKALHETVDGLYKSADAYLISSAAGEYQTVVTKATAEAIKAQLSPAQTAVKIADELNKSAGEAAEKGAKQVATLKDQADAQELLNAAVAAGTMSYAAAQQQLKLNADLAPLLAAMDAADAEGKTKLVTIIDAINDAYNRLNRDNGVSAIQKQTAAMSDQNEVLQKELDLSNASVMTRATEIAQLKAIQQLKANPSGPQQGDGGAGDKYIADQVNNAALGVRSSASQNSFAKYQQEYSDFLGNLQKQAQDAAADIGDSFGSIGKAFGNMVGVSAVHAKDQSDIYNKMWASIKPRKTIKLTVRQGLSLPKSTPLTKAALPIFAIMLKRQPALLACLVRRRRLIKS